MGIEGWEDALIITHEYHGARAFDIANFLKMKEPMVYPVTSQVLWMPWHKTRETLAFTKWIIERGLQAVGFASRSGISQLPRKLIGEAYLRVAQLSCNSSN